MLAHPQARLVTLTGPPGIGKTRLAVVCASADAERSGCAAVFVDLAPVRDPALVMVELAQAIGVEPRGGTDLAGQLAAALGREERLVVLDNCEHLLAAAPDIGRVLAACPRLRVLATSRERLRLSAEQEFPVPPLAMPASADVADLSCLAANPSVALLLDRARRTSPGFDLTPANALLLANACVRLEGLPLAIELAAARLKVLTPGELVFRLASRMEVLAGSTRDVPARQRALRSGTLAGPCPWSRPWIWPWRSLRAPHPVTRTAPIRCRSPRGSGRSPRWLPRAGPTGRSAGFWGSPRRPPRSTCTM
jgi:predicted ATPase